MILIHFHQGNFFYSVIIRIFVLNKERCNFPSVELLSGTMLNTSNMSKKNGGSRETITAYVLITWTS